MSTTELLLSSLAGKRVLIVGAGPTGLMAGLVLGRRGVPAIVVDRKAGPTRESRALAVQARTMEIYDHTASDATHREYSAYRYGTRFRRRFAR